MLWVIQAGTATMMEACHSAFADSAQSVRRHTGSRSGLNQHFAVTNKSKWLHVPATNFKSPQVEGLSGFFRVRCGHISASRNRVKNGCLALNEINRLAAAL